MIAPKYVNVTAIAGRRLASYPTSWQTPNCPYNVEHLAGMAPNGDLLVFWWSPRHNWQVVNVSKITGRKIAGPVTSWQTPDGPYNVEHLAGMAPNGDLLVFWWSPRHDWQVVNVSKITGSKIAGAVTSWQTPDGPYIVEHLAGMALNGDLLVFWWSSRHNWQVVNVSKITGRKIAGPVTSWQTPDGPYNVEHLAGMAPNGDLLVYWWSPRHDWQAVNASKIAGRKIAGPVTSWQTPDGRYNVEHLAGMAPNGDLLVFWWSPRHDWQVVNVSTIAGRKIAGPVTSWQRLEGSFNLEHLAGMAPNGDLLVFWWSPSHDWQVVNISKIAGRKIAGPVTSWQTPDAPDDVEHLAGVGANRDLALFYWKVRDLPVVVTQHNDNYRSGRNLNEQALRTSNVKVAQFGKLFSRAVDGQIYAQPLYLSKLDFRKRGVRNAVYVATMHNTVYAFDADNPAAGNPLWKRTLGPAVPLPDSHIGPGGYRDMEIEVGIVSTPVISRIHHALYVVAFTKNRGNYQHWLHALDLITGAEKFGGPVRVKGSVRKTDGSRQSVTFRSSKQLQRSSLLLATDQVYVAFASFGDSTPYHGWVFSFRATSLARTGIFNTTPNGGLGGIWQAGQGPTADDDGNLYFMTGNGSFDAHGSALGDSLVKLRPNLSLADWFSPFNNGVLDAADADLGSAGVMLIPHCDRLVGGGKEGKVYVLNRNHLGHYKPNNDSQIVQSFYVKKNHHIHGGPVFWAGAGGPYIYIWPENDYLKSYRLKAGKFVTTPASVSKTTAPRNVPGGAEGMPGGFLSISAHGNAAGTGIVWASHPYEANANQQTVAGILHAYDASDLRKELWNDKQNRSRDDVGLFAKFCPPTVANGKVYMATFSRYLHVYGLLKR